ncbi:MAG: hypothetical protein M3Z17_05695 [Gemmatimonadota bacterium]|nr:hypothetical protein [Gemmatimonadota bacterium]
MRRSTALSLLFVPFVAGAQQKRASFYEDQSVLNITLVADFGQLKHDTRDDKAPYRQAKIIYMADGKQVTVPVKIKPRGIWRRKTCDMPPIRLNFDKDSTHKTIFTKQNRMKLVVSCKNNDEAEQYLLSEFQLYRVQRLLTPLSFDARLAHVSFVDAKKGDTIQKRFAFFGEEPEDAARRLGGAPLMIKNARGDDLDPDASAMFGVFQYFIGNTDFSLTQLHNVLLLRKDSVFDIAFPVARDFDWSGAVNARYAFPDYRLPIKSVTQRLMKGDCAGPEAFERTFQIFRAKKDSIYGLYHDSLSAAMKPDVVKQTLKYFDDFYSEINKPWEQKHNIVNACGPS